MKVGILGATGSVGQRFIQVLESHPRFEVVQLFGEKSAGHSYDTIRWILHGDVPGYVRNKRVEYISSISPEIDIVFSALPATAAETEEIKLAEEGFMVASNASAHRMDDDVPILIPEVNPDHLSLLNHQQKERGWRGMLVTNPNCVTAVLCLALKPLLDAFGLSQVTVVTMQAISGAGYPGLPSLDILGNVIPYIHGEEEKIIEETRKILGTCSGNRISPLPLNMVVSCNRVPTVDGHIMNVFVETDGTCTADEVIDVFNNFSALPQLKKLPTAPEKPIIVVESEDRPQTRLDLHPMAITVGRIRKCENILAFTVLGHNTVRGAAGGSVLNAELMEVMNWMEKQ
ncbi:MAG: aspartate-semialdehyde dehydrogenase [Candidatus Thorarchaeota archaeon]|jgi:aspartate-semialdehyde dehydrogenase